MFLILKFHNLHTCSLVKWHFSEFCDFTLTPDKIFVKSKGFTKEIDEQIEHYEGRESVLIFSIPNNLLQNTDANVGCV